MIYVIGGSGFIGTHLCSILFKNSKEFKILDKVFSQNFSHSYVHADVTKELFNKDQAENVTSIINLAAEHRDDVTPTSSYYTVNVDGAINVCNFASRNNINRIIFTSSVAVYGLGTKEASESSFLNPFNDYGKSKLLAEKVYIQWQEEDPGRRSLVIIRPTVVFGEGNRGNVYNLFSFIAGNKFIMIGKGSNFKSMAYVGNLAAFLDYSLDFLPGIHIYNYIDKPDLCIKDLIFTVRKTLGFNKPINFYLPYFLALIIGYLFDIASFILKKKFTISSVRIKKFCANSTFNSSVNGTGFLPPFDIHQAIERTIDHEFHPRS
ncbi:NAD(P)-dependent oxidoreductase [Polynucleobacter sp. Nonnen-W13]|uniref:NAD-dependent epimerase/dehydratase family protein n=1 Tax=Polynucleobacter sp. Nonnen-W13 TaxID=1855625 RepID=UPI001C0C813E|nr:NAD(P)-dependent oxidoreductase [Polynucleobacter sp. Nonnen-W13]MBU3558370.1 NAD(P)-dependent oxidoreductase [Polynucleobacter sp. Nonnen-W13]